jgi:hypothetical protein
MESNREIIGLEEIIKFKTKIDACGTMGLIEFAGGQEYPQELIVASLTVVIFFFRLVWRAATFISVSNKSLWKFIFIWRFFRWSKHTSYTSAC